MPVEIITSAPCDVCGEVHDLAEMEVAIINKVDGKVWDQLCATCYYIHVKEQQ